MLTSAISRLSLSTCVPQHGISMTGMLLLAWLDTAPWLLLSPV
jgi:hypothetical protein